MAEKKSRIKVAPHSRESEMMVLGCMLTSLDALNVGADGLDELDFYFTEHKIIFQVLKAAYRKDKPADMHLVCEELRRMEKLEAIGGASYIATLAQYAGTSAYIEEYVEVVRSKSILRKMIYAAEMVEKSALEEPSDVFGALDEAQNLFFKICQSANSGTGVLISDLLSGVKGPLVTPLLKTLQERQEHFRTKGPKDITVTGIPSHYIDMDKLINGLNNAHLIILAARPAMGKTAFALNIAENVCFKNNLPVGIFSLEMTAEQLLYRLITSQAEVESDKIRSGNLTGVDFQRIVSAVGEMQKHTMVIDDQPGLKITDLRSRARRMKEAYGIRLLIIDYLQLLSGSNTNRNTENRQNEISEISRMLKTLARELDIPIICLSQLSRKVEDRPGHRPLMSDLRESGCLTADTLIQDAITGTFYTIKELAERKEQKPLFVYALSSDLKLKKERMIKAFYSGKKQIFALTTRSGRRIKASANHPFYKLQGWTALEKLCVGDRIALPRKLSISTNSCIKDDEIILLAHLLGDGCILPNQPYHYTSEDKQNLLHVSTAAENLFSIIPRLVQQKNWYHLYLPSPFKLTPGIYHPITNWFKKLGIERARSYEKKIPSVIFECSEEKIALFLHHLWGADGNISPKILPDRNLSCAIYYASTSLTLGRQVQHLLLRLGIQSTLKTVPAKARAIYQVHIQGSPDQISFLTKIGSSGKRGEKIKEYISQLNNTKLQQLAESDVFWDEIVSIEPLGKEDVYDATVENAHNFVANDILVHNSIEQDSDIVMFLLRREYYDSNDKPGMAEVIVAKNRHGSIGTVNLTFLKEFAQFRNYSPQEIELQEEESSFANL